MIFSKNIKIKAILLLLLLMLPVSSWAQLACDADFVTIGASGIEVTPNGLDDTDNIQCALESVSTLFGGVPGVRLSAGDFFISSIVIENYKGYLQGESRETTSLVVLNGSIDCAAMNTAGQLSAAIKFIRGEPVIRFMTMELGITVSGASVKTQKNLRGSKPQAAAILSPCLDSDTPLGTFIHFTGKSANDPSCGNDVIFPVADRLDLLGPGRRSNLIVAGILAAPEGDILGGCKNTLLGRLTVNRSWIGNFNLGVYTALKGGAHVDLTFNELFDNAFGVFINNSNQTTTLSNNIFDVLHTDDTIQAAGIYLTTTRADAPNTTKAVISDNLFIFDGGAEDTMDAIGVYNDEGVAPPQSVGLFVSNNRYDLYGDDVVGLWIEAVSNGTVSGNRFTGEAYRVAAIYADGPENPAQGWTFTSNGDLRNFESLGGSDIRIGENVNGTFIGDGQHHSLSDSGAGTISIGEDANPGEAPVDQQLTSKGTSLKPSPLRKRNTLPKFLSLSK